MSKISNYTDLMAEQKLIEARIVEQKAILNKGISALKDKVEPFLYLLPILNIFKKKDSNTSLLKFATSAGIELLVGQKFLSKSNWLMRLIMPMLVKTFSSKAIVGGGEDKL